MFRLRRTIGWLFLVVVAIFLVSLLGANLYVQSQATQERIQQELSQRLKMPLQIQRISVTPWGGLKLSGITIPQMKKIRLSDGSFHFLDHEKRNIALFDGVQFSSSMRDVDSIRGQVRIDKIVLRDRVFLSALRSPIRYDPSEIELFGITAQIAKGQLTGDFSMEPQAEDSPFTVHASFHRVQADDLVAEAGGARDMIRGVLVGTLDATGKTADPDALTGSGTILLQNGHVQQFAVLAALGQLLQIEELMQLDLEQAEAKYRLAGNTVLVDELLLRSPNLRLTATGSVSLRGKLALNSVLAINEKIRSQLFRGIRENFVPTSEPGEYALQFHVGGTVDKPKTDLMERAVGADLKDLGGVIDALLGHGKSKKKKNAESPTPSAPPKP